MTMKLKSDKLYASHYFSLSLALSGYTVLEEELHQACETRLRALRERLGEDIHSLERRSKAR
jgi:hypothetical protein